MNWRASQCANQMPVDNRFGPFRFPLTIASPPRAFLAVALPVGRVGGIFRHEPIGAKLFRLRRDVPLDSAFVPTDNAFTTRLVREE